LTALHLDHVMRLKDEAPKLTILNLMPATAAEADDFPETRLAQLKNVILGGRLVVQPLLSK
jgi:hypothetical protein